MRDSFFNLILLVFVSIITNVVNAQVITKSDREKLAYEYIEDSCSKYININFLEREPLPIDDRVFMYSDTTCLQYRNSENQVKTHCYSNFDNYVYRDVGDSIANEFQISNQMYILDSMTWWFSKVELADEPNDSISLIDPLDVLNEMYEGAGSWISRPVFNSASDLMIVEFGNVCGALCGYGVTFLYEFKKGRWFIKRKIIEWVS